MNIQELEYKHRVIWREGGENPWVSSNNHTKLSVEFAIIQLKIVDEIIFKELGNSLEFLSINSQIQDEIKELKKYLDEK